MWFVFFLTSNIQYVSNIPTELPEVDLIKPDKLFYIIWMSFFTLHKIHTLPQAFVWFALNTQY